MQVDLKIVSPEPTAEIVVNAMSGIQGSLQWDSDSGRGYYEDASIDDCIPPRGWKSQKARQNWVERIKRGLLDDYDLEFLEPGSWSRCVVINVAKNGLRALVWFNQYFPGSAATLSMLADCREKLDIPYLYPDSYYRGLSLASILAIAERPIRVSCNNKHKYLARCARLIEGYGACVRKVDELAQLASVRATDDERKRLRVFEKLRFEQRLALAAQLLEQADLDIDHPARKWVQKACKSPR